MTVREVLKGTVFPSSTREGGTKDIGVTPTTASSPTRPVIYAVLFSEVRSLQEVAQVVPVRVATTKVRTRAIVPAEDPECTLTTPGAVTEEVPVGDTIAMGSKAALSTKVCNLGSFLLLSVFSVSFLLFSVLPYYPRGE